MARELIRLDKKHISVEQMKMEEPFGELSQNTFLSQSIRLLLHQRSDVEFEWTPYNDPAIQAVISDKYFQNLNAWHVKVPLLSYAKVEIHQSDRVLSQFRFRQLIPVAPEVFNDETKLTYGNCIRIGRDTGHTISKCGKIELAYVPEYMPWFRIHGKPYLLSDEERRRQIHAQRERRGPLNSRRRDDDASPSTAPTRSLGPTVQSMTPTSQPF
ncbi:hypothetical protein J1N35_002165 [Gossypium stocksii]|uniref:Aminotransferase-like plant mobile domain-containing protein n=1 Tax=Gossypium stocksii TaxID=47602 RepID=A0A9D4AM41_9ROSI|nr:hypothetical protein J1N35_002165 [Gossypium stocksii]